MMDESWGMPKSGEQEETFLSHHYTLGYAPATTLTEKEIMPRSLLTEEWQSGNFFDLSAGQNLEIVGIKASSMMQFAQRGTSEPAAIAMMHFYKRSVIQFTKGSVTYDRIPLIDLLPFNMEWGVTDVQYFAKQNPFYRFTSPIQIPKTGFTIKFKPASNLTTAADATTNPQGVGHADVSSTHLFTVDFFFYGRRIRQVA